MRLIDADELKGHFPKDEDWDYPVNTNSYVVEIIDNAPTVEPVRHGHWIFNSKDALEMMFTLPKCSKCGVESSDGGNYCSHCGAKMDERYPQTLLEVVRCDAKDCKFYVNGWCKKSMMDEVEE